ncbi:MAG: cysteine--tRNA ligase [Candidatus Thermoplasmatota archaeon]
MTLYVHNTLTGRKEEFTPLSPGRVGMYVCGINTYDYSHMGHAKAAVTFDLIRRHLGRRGFAVRYVVNFTDIEDHCIERAQELGISIDALAERYISEYFKDMRALGVVDADIYPRASHHIKEIIEAVERLIEKGYAYEAGNSVYFSVSKSKDYGKLSHQRLEEMRAGARVEPEEGKRDPMDFALWKAMKPGEPHWDSPWGKGRPGWHIECSVMSMKYLGETFDIHGGGTELIFPHHENEILQSEALTGKPFVRYWLHGGLLMIRGEKMSKSLGNFFTIREVVERYQPEVVRFFLLNTHYRKPIDFNEEALAEAGQALGRLRTTHERLRSATTASSLNTALFEKIREAEAAFEKAMDDDFNTREAVSIIFEISRELNKAMDEGMLCHKAKAEALALFSEFEGLFRVLSRKERAGEELIAPLMGILLELREDARKRKDFKTADLIRDRLKELGISVEDTAEGVEWRMA